MHVNRFSVYVGLVMALGAPAKSLAEAATRPTTTTTTSASLPFPLFDAMLFERRLGAPDVGMSRIYVTDREFWDGQYPNFKTDEPSERRCRAFARRIAPRKCPVVIDIEHWPTDVRHATEAEVRTSLQKLIAVLDWMRDERPELKLGLYGILPSRDYWTPVSYLQAKALGAATPPARLAQLEARYNEWVRSNDLVRGILADKIDFVCPSIYTFYDDQAGWELYARANIAEAKKAGKPVYPFLWMEYHEEGPIPGGGFIPGDFWRRQLDLCHQTADGAIIWGGWKRRWDEKAPWWVETKAFLQQTIPTTSTVQD